MKAVSLLAALTAAGFAWYGVWAGAIVFGLVAALAARRVFGMRIPEPR